MTRIIISFDGTGLEGREKSVIEGLPLPSDLYRIYFKGCHSQKTGNGRIFPNLSGFIEKVSRAFRADCLDLSYLSAEFKEAISICYPAECYQRQEAFDSQASKPKEKPVKKIRELLLVGYSRGAVSAFLLAKKLFQIGNQLPLKILANQPVPGNALLFPPTIGAKLLDLRLCTNIKTVCCFIGAYHRPVGWYHDTFFKQIVPFLPENIEKTIIELPIYSHFSSEGVRLSRKYLKLWLVELGYAGTTLKIAEQLLLKKTLKAEVKEEYGEPLSPSILAQPLILLRRCSSSATSLPPVGQPMEGSISLANPLETHSQELLFLATSKKKYKQPFFGDEQALQPDLIGQEVLSCRIQKIISGFWKEKAESLFSSLTTAQKKAIFSLSFRFPEDEQLKTMITFIHQGNAQAEKWTTVINRSISFMAVWQKQLDKRSKKAELLAQKEIFLKNIFLISYDFFQQKTFSPQERERCFSKLKEEGERFISKALIKQPRSSVDTFYDILLNLISLTLGLAILNVVQVYKSRSFFLHKKTGQQVRFEKEMEKARKILLAGAEEVLSERLGEQPCGLR